MSLKNMWRLPDPGEGCRGWRAYLAMALAVSGIVACGDDKGSRNASRDKVATEDLPFDEFSLNLATQKVSFKSKTLTRYLSATGDVNGRVSASAAQSTASETFTLFDINGAPLSSGDTVYLQAANGNFIAEDPASDPLLVVPRTSRAARAFKVERAEGAGKDLTLGDMVALRTATGTLVGVAAGTGLTLTSVNALGESEKFQMLAPGGTAPQPPATLSYADVQGIISTNCTACHNGKVTTPDFTTVPGVIGSRAAMQAAVQSGRMPPTGFKDAAQKDTLLRWLSSGMEFGNTPVGNVCKVTEAAVSPALRRLNKVELAASVRDIVGATPSALAALPADEIGNGFDNNASVLSVTSLHLETYLKVAQEAAAAAFTSVSTSSGVLPANGNLVQSLEGCGGPAGNGGLELYRGGCTAQLTRNVTDAGSYRVRVRAYQRKAGPEDARLSATSNGTAFPEVTVTATTEAAAQSFDFTVNAVSGKVVIAFGLANDFYDAAATPPDRNLVVQSLEVTGPLGNATAGTSTTAPALVRALDCVKTEGQTQACARKALTQLASRAYRRPATTAEVDVLAAAYVKAAGTPAQFQVGMRAAISTMLAMPQFLFRWELKETDAASGTDYSLASRLSYFLWSSPPDDELTRLASQGMLRNADVLAAQTTRMLKDPRAQAFIDNFAGQWVGFRYLENAKPDVAKYPSFTPQVRAAFAQEPRYLFNDVLGTNRSLLDLMRADYSYLNAASAGVYGISGVTGTNLQKVSLVGTQRRGLLGQGAWLTVNAYSGESAPIRRGKRVLEDFLCAAPPPPPPDIAALNEAKVPANASIRDRLAAHRTQAVCAGCHASMDPIGLGLENFNAVGAWRLQDHFGNVIKADGVLPPNRSFANPLELSDVLAGDERFPKCFARKALTYALGREPQGVEGCRLDESVANLAAQGYPIVDLIKLVVTSPAFTTIPSSQGVAK